MKKLKLAALNFQDDEILSRNQLRNILGGSSGPTYCTAQAWNCPGVSCSCPNDGYNSYACYSNTDFATCICNNVPNYARC